MHDAISLFSGACGLDLGLERAGIRIAIGQDFAPQCCDTMEANGRRCIRGDVQSLSASALLERTGITRGEPFLVCGGPPCQPFSTAGKRLGVNDPRGSLFADFVRIVNGVRPRFFVFENVKGLVSSAVDAGGRPGGVLDVILEEFRRIGYKTVHGLLDAVEYGVPQFRERLIIIGSRDGEDVFLPVPSHFQRHQLAGMRWQTLRQAIGDLEDDPGPCASFSPERLKYLRLVPEGGNWKSLPKRVLKDAMGGAYESGGGKVGFYRRLDYSQPSPTVVTSPVQKATMMCHPTQDRPLSVREYARLQQFPDSWKLTGTTADQYRQIGNAVPVGLGEAVGRAILAAADGVSTIRTKRNRGTSAHRFLQERGKAGAPLLDLLDREASCQ
ncbi:MAG: DNA cytosine methyltransferase [Desulfovibrio sp.]|nr:DNA cytosine methyltransferase [Desulfovibrio sp.]